MWTDQNQALQTFQHGGYPENLRCPKFPLVGWWKTMFLFPEPPLTTGLFDDRWYAKPAQTYFYQKDMIV